MRKILLAVAVALLCSTGARAQGTRTHGFTGVENDVAISNIGSGIAYHTLGWNPAATVLTCAGKLQQSVNGTVWTDLIASMNCAVPGTSVVTAGSVNYVRMIVTSFTGTGTTFGIWRGYTSSPTGVVPGGSPGEIQYNVTGTSFGGVAGLTNGLAADCDGFGTPCYLKFAQNATNRYLALSTFSNGPAGNYTALNGAADATDVSIDLSAWNGTLFPTLQVNTNIFGIGGAGVVVAPKFVTPLLQVTGGFTDLADTGVIRLPNNQNVCWEANPAGTDGCLYINAQNNFQVDGVHAILAPAISLNNNPVAGFVVYAGGTTAAAVSPCNNATAICEQAPATGLTSYVVTKPPVAAQGTLVGRNTAAVITQGFSGDADHSNGSAGTTIGSGTSIGSTSLCSTTNCPVGTYRVNVYVDITTPCGTTGTYVVNLIYTDDQGSKTVPVNINCSCHWCADDNFNS